MATKKGSTKKIDVCSRGRNDPSAGGSYFLGFVGAAVYYVMTATGFWNGVWGIIKAIVWPAFLVFELFTYLGL